MIELWGAACYGQPKVDDFNRSEVGHALQGVPGEGMAAGGLKGGLVWLGRLAKVETVVKETVVGSEGLADLVKVRAGLGLKAGEGTIAKLDVGGKTFYGINAHGQPTTMSVNAITRTHAEADAFQQALNAGARGGNATLHVDGALCMACGQNGGVAGMARQLGVQQVTVITPQGVTVIRP